MSTGPTESEFRIAELEREVAEYRNAIMSLLPKLYRGSEPLAALTDYLAGLKWENARLKRLLRDAKKNAASQVARLRAALAPAADAVKGRDPWSCAACGRCWNEPEQEAHDDGCLYAQCVAVLAEAGS